MAGTARFLGAAFLVAAGEGAEEGFLVEGAEEVSGCFARPGRSPLSSASAEKAAALVRLPRGASAGAFFFGAIG